MIGLAEWLNAPPTCDVRPLPDGRGVYTMCRCGARVEASSTDQVRSMLAGHWMFDTSHRAFTDRELAEGKGGVS